MSGLQRLRRRRRQITGEHLSRRMQGRAYLMALVALVLVWTALWGSVSPVLVLLGVLFSAVVLLLFPLPALEFRVGLHPWRTVVLVVTFGFAVVRAGLNVCWLAVRPRLPRSEITTVQLDTQSDLVQTLTALAVSLVPGSLIIDADPDRRTLQIHVLDTAPGDLERFAESVRTQERRIVAAVGAGPRDRPPRRTGTGERPTGRRNG
ncbi:Na+/H+ antiporter subunit E [Nakamurella leprariae]|uniref:Na+/H+ antiporter subunit E n=1 Tax=Nakamurella leprariae TaxID=2803911 RepID=A0A938YJD6_9ACTN|nr:Na+/H+ antiporter subunit E [Nakamurella leprariae]MBM9469229.1 Na+/H+ antiporter subunit E [Nakamurella leprariae]